MVTAVGFFFFLIFHIQVSSQKSVSSRTGSAAANQLQQAAAAWETHAGENTQLHFDSLNL